MRRQILDKDAASTRKVVLRTRVRLLLTHLKLILLLRLRAAVRRLLRLDLLLVGTALKLGLMRRMLGGRGC